MLNRLTLVHFPADATKDITYSYDSPSVTFGIGRLTGMTDPSGTTAYHYDEYGSAVKEEKTFASLPMQTTQYSYNDNGNIALITYPDGRKVHYEYDDADTVTRVWTEKPGTATKDLASNIAHMPFGGIASFTYGAGLTEIRNYDMAGRLTYLKSGPFLKKEYAYDANGNITGITDLVNSAKSQSFTYDALNRLVSATGAYGSLVYEYDAVGNRTRKTVNGAETDYTYAPGTNRLLSATGAEPATYTYEENGNMISDGTNTYEYETGGTPLPIVGAPTVPEPNVFLYTGNNPMNYIDRYGLFNLSGQPTYEEQMNNQGGKERYLEYLEYNTKHLAGVPAGQNPLLKLTKGDECFCKCALKAAIDYPLGKLGEEAAKKMMKKAGSKIVTRMIPGIGLLSILVDVATFNDCYDKCMMNKCAK